MDFSGCVTRSLKSHFNFRVNFKGIHSKMTFFVSIICFFMVIGVKVIFFFIFLGSNSVVPGLS